MSIMTSTAAHHRWTFFRAGGLDQVQLTTSADLRALHTLDQKLWVALSCPVKGLQIDPRTLSMLDTDHDVRVRVTEVIAAVKWTCEMLKEPGYIFQQRASLPLSEINDASEGGRKVLAAAHQLLANLGKPEATAVSIEDITDTTKLFINTTFNGDGVVIIDAATEPSLRQVLLDIITLFGEVKDRSGKAGVDKLKADTFFTECEAYHAWLESGAQVQLLGEASAVAYFTFSIMKGKITDYFQRCRLVAYDPRAAVALNRAEEDYLLFAAKDLSLDPHEVVGLPLQRIDPNKPIELLKPVNPVWADKLQAFSVQVIAPLLGTGRTTLSDADWAEICRRFAPYEAWQAARKPTTVEWLGDARIRAIIAGGLKQQVAELIAKDLEVQVHVEGFDQVERLVRYYRDLGLLLRNYVNFADFYNPRVPAVFQGGTLYLDQRSCTLCIQVDDPAAHVVLGGLGKVYIAYCACSRSSGEKMNIAACFTQGDSDYLMVGRNGVFYDRQGKDWDATITKIIDNPISIRQAFWSPYKKFVRFIEQQVAKRAAAADDAANARLEGAATTVAAPPPGKPAAAPKPSFDVGTIAALGVGLGAIGGIIGGFISGFLGLKMLMPLGIFGLMLLISGPAMVIAWLKLRQRTLGPILEGNGWAINGRVKINLPLGAALTGIKQLPPGSTRLLKDPFVDYAALRRRWAISILIGALLATVVWWQWGWLVRQWNAAMTPDTVIDTKTKIPADGTAVTTSTSITQPAVPAPAPAAK